MSMRQYMVKRNWYMKFEDDSPYRNVHFLIVGIAEAPAHAGARTISNILAQEKYTLVPLTKGK